MDAGSSIPQCKLAGDVGVPVERCAPARRRGGFTLVELMVTVAVAAILITIAVPSFSNAIASNRLNSAANEIVGALNTARMEAIQRNAGVQFCSNNAASNTTVDTLASACATSGAAVEALNNGVPVAVRAVPTGLTSPVQLSGNIAAIRFNGQGLGFQPSAPGTPFDSTASNTPVADICVSTLKADNHRVISMAAGSVVTTTTTTGNCP